MFGLEAEAETFKIDTILAGLIKRLPPAGANWPAADRAKWMAVWTDSLALIYKDEKPAS